MKKRLGRELWWMIAPVLLLGGGAWWLQNGGKIGNSTLKNPFDPGPIRIEFTPFEKVELTPFEVWQGIDWAAKTNLTRVGDEGVPKAWKHQWTEAGVDRSLLRLVYRKGKVWKRVTTTDDEKPVVSGGLTFNTTAFQVDLQNVPHDADEVRLRGKFQHKTLYYGVIPIGWRRPTHIKVMGLDRILTFQSKSFDIQIKGPGEPFPKPVVSRVSPLQFVDAKWIVEGGGNDFVLQMRRTDGEPWGNKGPNGLQVQITDEKGRPVLWGRDNSSFGGAANQDLFSPNRASTDRFAYFLNPDPQHDQSYEVQMAGPLRLRAQVTDGICWPLSIDVKVPRVEMKRSDFGAAK